MHALVHELTLLQERDGWLSDPELKALAKRLGLPLHRLESVSTFYTHFRRTPPKRVEVAVCRDLSCEMARGGEAAQRLRTALAGRDDVEIREISCLGRCDRAPAAFVGHAVVSTTETDDVVAIVDGRSVDSDVRPTPNWGEAEVYRDAGDRYDALRSALGGARSALSETLETSGLRGMGGAGFPTGKKWSLVASESSTPKYVICNADESEPGTFKDREVLRDLPHLVIEGMALAAYCVGAERGWVFIRHEYEPERAALQAAIDAAYAAGALGKNLFGSDFSFELEVFVSPGGYILGEETALLECMEDRRGEPRNKPPFPGVEGLWNQPTLINNVETFAHATGILHHGVDWWRSLGESDHAGHKFISVSGDVERPGVELVPMGSTLGELLERCGGMRDGQRLIAIAPGGASSNFLPPDKLDIAIDFGTLEAAGSMLGSGAAVFVGESTDLLEAGRSVTRFFRNESCGKCVPCRVGTEKAVEMLESVDNVSDEQRSELEQLHATLARTSICGLGQVALGPLLSILNNFPAKNRRS
ncbi:MAG: NAD(P)H-dependent oxidoreductase subunit E [Deltaproteobacteria bacterium]|nr:NAD(P)H-dependent oxidoreductase subunit E [Deltaproteobacteria bacterium]